ncbi:hypothetical protein [Piscicoccus intestinalis]|uniref:hypothetical protein n=1 Tax=Piscicoccus intestinalis TaxID=746033 RepID=UPI00083960BD|nr:hypothetical protein [Piscicoccus intestinalis]
MSARHIVVAAALAGWGGVAVCAAPAAAAPTPAAPTPAGRATAGPATASPSAGVALPAKGPPGDKARRLLGASRSPHPWHSGAWVGGYMSAKRANQWGAWRGSASDTTPTFPERGSWRAIETSTWHIDTYRGFDGVLSYGLPLLPEGVDPNRLQDVAAGRHDATFRTIARDLRTRGRANTLVKIGWEPNGTWWSWSADKDSARHYRQAFRRVAAVMNKETPQLTFAFEINCGSALPGQTGRLDSLTRLYPGNEAVDVIGCSAYDWSGSGATTEAQWRSALHPRNGAGVGDVAAFARAKGKGLSFTEWGLAPTSKGGNGDNPFFIRKMKQFFDSQADILVMESYFNEPDATMRNGLWAQDPQNPRAAAAYRQLW